MYKPIFNKRSVLKFTHFTNKGYSLFACLGREVIIGVLSVVTLEHATASGISIETDKITTDSTTKERGLELEEVHVIGTRAPLTQSQQARMVTVLSREDIQSAAAQSVNDLLKMAVGVDVRQRGPLGAQTDVSVRGSNYEQITILLNGINICDPQTGHNAFDFPVGISDIERIEILEGPAGRVYGTSSLLGAINIITKGSHLDSSTLPLHYSTHPSPSVNFHLEGGSYGYLSLGGRISTLWQKEPSATYHEHSLSASYSRSDGYSRNKAGGLNADYQGGKAFYQGRLNSEHLLLQWQAGVSAKSFGSNTFYGIKWDDQYEHTLKTNTAIQGELKCGQFHLRPAVYWNHNEDRFELFRDAPERYPFNYHRTDIIGLNLNGWFDWALGRTAVGAEMRNEDLVSSNLGEKLDNPKPIHGTTRYYEHGLNRTNISFFAEHNILLHRFTLSAGLTAVKNSWADMGVRLYPGIDLSYRLQKGWKLYASYNTSLRMPSATELYYSVGGHQADKHLKPEEIAALEAGVRYHTSNVDGKVGFFYNHYSNLIDWIRHTDDGPDAPWESTNFGKINAIGVESSLTLNLRGLFPHQQIFKTLSVSHCYLHQDQQETGGIQSMYALEYLRNKLTTNLQMSIWKQLTLGISYRMQKRTGSYTDANGNINDYATYGIVDAKLAWETPKLKVYVEGNNLFDKSYVDYGHVPQPGAWLIAGLQVSL